MRRRKLSRVVRKLIAYPYVLARRTLGFCIDWCFPTYDAASRGGELQDLLDSAPSPGEMGLDDDLLRESTEHFLRHRFDLLGSGWTTVAYGMRYRGVRGFSYPPSRSPHPDAAGDWLRGRVSPGNLTPARAIWQLLDADYEPIDWQVDFKSGYRWSERRWYHHVPFKEGGGVDIKVPWELARMQHHVELAWAFACAVEKRPGFRESSVYAREFRNQILDFCATNPPRFGVNWRCTMDVAIRVANWILAHGMFRALGASFDSDFERILTASVVDHAKYIVANLEWFEHGRGNHYLANISGLVFAAAALPASETTDKWLAFAARELIREVEHQFHPDGTGAEASTAYHCLCVEMVVYASAVLLGLAQARKKRLRMSPGTVRGSRTSASIDIFPAWYTERMERMAEFVVAMTKPDGTIPQIGDNDSGRFVLVLPRYERQTAADVRYAFDDFDDYDEIGDDEPYLVRSLLDRRHVVAAVNGLFGRSDLDEAAGEFRREAKMVAALARGETIDTYHVAKAAHDAASVVVGSPGRLEELLEEWRRAPPERRSLIEFPIAGAKSDTAWTTSGFPDFGLYLVRSPRVYLAIRCGVMGKNVIGAHAHNDQLAVELTIDGKNILRDPGSYLYMPAPELRNRYRSVTAHFTPQAVNLEPSRLDDHVFYLDFDHPGECLCFGPTGFVGRHEGEAFAFYRAVRWNADDIRILDWSPTHDLASLSDFHPPPFSPGYGIRLNSALAD